MFIQKPSEYFIDYTFPFKTAVTLPPKFTFHTGIPPLLLAKRPSAHGALRTARLTNCYCIICNLLCFFTTVTAFSAHRNLSQPALIHHSFSRPISACLDLSQLIITYHNPQRFIAVRVIVYPLLILTYKFTKIKGFSKKFLKLSKAAF